MTTKQKIVTYTSLCGNKYFARQNNDRTWNIYEEATPSLLLLCKNITSPIMNNDILRFAITSYQNSWLNKGMKVNIIAALDNDGGIGKNDGIPWKAKGELAHFKKLTKGHIVVMGRATYESLDGGALKDRINIVLSKTLKDVKDDVILCQDFNALQSTLNYLSKFYQEKTAWIIGGNSVYKHFLNKANELHLSLINSKNNNCDTFFPNWEQKGFQLESVDNSYNGWEYQKWVK